MSRTKKTITFLTCLFFSALVIIVSFFVVGDNKQNTLNRKISHAVETNVNLGLDSIYVPPLFNCDWSPHLVQYNDDELVNESDFSEADCTNYFPETYAKDFFMYIKGVSSMTAAGIVVETYDNVNNEPVRIIPSIKEVTKNEAFDKYNTIQEHMASSLELNSPISIFGTLSHTNNELGLLFEMDRAHKIKSVLMGASKLGGEIQLTPLNVGVNPGVKFELYIGYLNDGETLLSTIEKINDETLTVNNGRFWDFSNKVLTNNPSDRSISPTKSFSSLVVGGNDWNKHAFTGEKAITTTSCVEHTKNSLGLTNFNNADKFCDYLIGVYQSDNGIASTNSHFSIDGNNLNLANELIWEIDGNNSLRTYNWDLMFFGVKKIDLSNFSFGALSQQLVEKFIEKYQRRATSSPLQEVSIVNMNLNDEIVKDSLVGLWINLPSLVSLDLSNNLISFEEIVNIIEEVQIQQLAFINGFASIESFDLTAQSNLSSLKLSGNSIETIILNSQQLTNLELSGLGLTEIIGLENASLLKHADLSSNNLSSITLHRGIQMDELDISKNSFSLFPLVGNQAIKKLNISDNKLESLSHPGNLLLEELNIENNEITTLLQSSENLRVLMARNNKINSLTIKFPKLEVVDLSENPDIQALLNGVNFQANSLTDLTLNDVGLTELNSSWFGNQTNEYKIDISNKNEITSDDNKITTLTINTLNKMKELEAKKIGLQSFLVSSTTSSLETINLADNNLSSIDFGNITLKKLNLRSIVPSQTIIEEIASKKDTIEELVLSNTKDSWTQLLLFNIFPKLKLLDLSSNGLTEIPSYFSQLRDKIEVLNLSSNNILGRMDLSGYLKLKEIDLSHNTSLLSVINVNQALLLEKLSLSSIPKAMSRITSGNDNLKELNIANSKLISADNVAKLFPNLEQLDISGNDDLDVSTLQGISASTISATVDGDGQIADIFRIAPKVQVVSLLGVEFDLLKFTNALLVQNIAYRIQIDADKLVIKGTEELLRKWYEDFSFRRVFLIDEDNNNIYLNKLIIDREFEIAKEKYSIEESQIKEQKKLFEVTPPILNLTQYNDLKNQLDVAISLKNLNKVVDVESRQNEYNNSLVAKISETDNNLTTFEATLYTLIVLSFALSLGIVILSIFIFRNRFEKRERDEIEK